MSVIKFMNAQSRRGLALCALAALVAAPCYTSFAVQRLLVEVFTVFSIALAWNLLAGYGGLVAVGQHMFVGVGAYALFAISNAYDVNPWLCIPFAAIASVILALLSAWPMFRLVGANFAVGTWVLAEMLRIGAVNSAWLGAGGGMPLEAIRAFDRVTRNESIYWAALAIGVSALFGGRALLKGRLGLALTSMRDAEIAADANGVAVHRAKLALWVISAAITGSAGAVAYMSTLQVTPDASFGINWTAAAIFIAVLGGIGTIEGPIVGTAIYFGLREAFSDYGSWYFIGLGMLAMLTMMLAPSGAWGFIARRWRIDPFGMRREMPH